MNSKKVFYLTALQICLAVSEPGCIDETTVLNLLAKENA